MEPTLIFDGSCGFCTRAVGWLRTLDWYRQLRTVPYQQPGVPESIGATAAQCAASVQWRGADGLRASGAAAINAALSVALLSELPMRVYGRTAGLQDRLYHWVAERRHKLPGVTPWCERYPDECDSADRR